MPIGIDRLSGWAVIAGCLIAIMEPFAWGTESASTVAVLVVDEGDQEVVHFADLLEDWLGRKQGMVILNRADVSKVLAEHSLSIALGHGRRSSSVHSGKLLKAGLLIVLARDSPDRTGIIEAAIIETRNGLRVQEVQVPPGQPLEAMAQLLADEVARWAERASGGFRCVFAVPPFEPLDLVYDFHHLRSVYTQAVERVLRELPGVVVVELEHAAEIARELALPMGTKSVTRGLPYYIFGSYRHDNWTENRRVTLRLRLVRGTELLAEREGRDLPPDDVFSFLRKEVLAIGEETIGSVTSPDPPRGDPKAEVDLLWERARWFGQRGKWDEMIRLCEAGLLLDPTRTELRYGLIGASRLRSHEQMDDRSAVRLQFLALTHLRDLYHRPGQVRRLPSAVSALWSMGRARHKSASDPLDDPAEALGRNLYDLKVRITLDLIERYPQEAEAFARAACEGRRSKVGEKEQADYACQVLTALGRTQPGFAAQCAFLETWKSYGWELHEILARLEARSEKSTEVITDVLSLLLSIESPDDEGPARSALEACLTRAFPEERSRNRCRHSADYLLNARLASVIQRRHPVAKESPDPRDGPIQFTPIVLSFADGRKLDRGRSLPYWVNCEYAGDVYYELRGGPLIISDPGKVRALSGIAGPLLDVEWDGRYIWLAIAKRNERVQVVDPQTMKVVATYTHADGVPPITDACQIAALAPGKVCVLGYFGPSWIATLSLADDPGSPPTKDVDVFHEAARIGEWKVHALVRGGPWERGADFPTAVSWAYAVTADHDDARYVVAGGLMTSWLTVADPRGRNVELVPVEWKAGRSFVGTFFDDPAVALDRIYTRGFTDGFRDGQAQLFIVLFEHKPPTFTPVEVGRMPLDASMGGGLNCLYDEGRIHIVDERWTTLDVSGPGVREVRSVPMPMPPGIGVPFMSSVYGLVLQSGTGAWQVRFLDEDRPADAEPSAGQRRVPPSPPTK